MSTSLGSGCRPLVRHLVRVTWHSTRSSCSSAQSLSVVACRRTRQAAAARAAGWPAEGIDRSRRSVNHAVGVTRKGALHAKWREDERGCVYGVDGGADGFFGGVAQVSISSPHVRPTWGVHPRRWFRVVVPVRMGRRSSKIATRKTAQDERKAKIYGRMGKQIVKTVKDGGPDPKVNVQLGALLQQAKELGVPKEIIDRNIKRATDKSQANFVEITYEVYGLGGVGMVVEVLTDNVNRTAATVRDRVKKGGGKMADPGSVLFNFKRVGAILARADDSSLLLGAAIDAGAMDVVEEPPSMEEDAAANDEGGGWQMVLTTLEQLASVKSELEQAGVEVEPSSSGARLIPLVPVETDEEVKAANEAIMQSLLELDDVDAVYSNQK